MSIKDHFLLLDASDYVDISVGNDDGLGIVRQVVEVIELLDLVRLVLEVEEVTVRLFDREDRDFLDDVGEIGRLGDRDTTLVGLHSPCEVLGGDGVAENLGQFYEDAIIDPYGGALRDRLELVGPICKLVLQELDLLVKLLVQVLSDHLIVRNIPKVVVRSERLHLLLELDQPLDVLIEARVLLEIHFPHIDQLKADL